MNTHITITERFRRQNRDLALFQRLFADWSRDRDRHSVETHQRLDTIAEQLARLERRIAMAVPSVRPARPMTDRPDSRRAATPLAAYRS